MNLVGLGFRNNSPRIEHPEKKSEANSKKQEDRSFFKAI